MIRTLRLFLAIEALAFLTAALIHFGILFQGYEHPKAPIAESVIGGVLIIGLLATFVNPNQAATFARWAQIFAAVGTCVGLFTIAIGVGPRTAPDLVFHAAILATLIYGLFVVQRRVSREAR